MIRPTGIGVLTGLIVLLLPVTETPLLAASETIPTTKSQANGPRSESVPAGGPLSPPKGPQKVPGNILAPAEPTPLEDLLLEKGLITIDDWIRIKAQEEQQALEQATELQMTGSPRWYERIRVNGYMQMRYAFGPSTNKFDIPLGDRRATTSPNQFYFRRIRMVFQGQVSDRMSFYFQPALEGDGQNLFNNEIIDAFADYHLTKDKVFRLRFGLHRVPNAFDTYRSSSQRQELDRHESVQTGAPGERDLGLALYWTPKEDQHRYAQLAQYHNGPGDYGSIGIMVYNGQTRNRPEQNADKHVGVKVSHPFELPNGRLLEAGMFAFRGQFVVTGTGPITSPTAASRCPNQLRGSDGCQMRDERLTWYVFTPPQPWGILAEYTLGRGPKRNAQGILEETHLNGGYVQLYYTWRYSDIAMLTPYIRYGEYHGGIKTIRGADGESRTWNFGLVWEPDTHWRFVTELMLKEGLNTTLVAGKPQADFNGSLIRFQAQWFFN